MKTINLTMKTKMQCDGKVQNNLNNLGNNNILVDNIGSENSNSLADNNAIRWKGPE